MERTLHHVSAPVPNGNLILETEMELTIGSARRLGIIMLAAVVVLIPSMRQPVAEEAATSKTFSQQGARREVLAPIALYPDALLAQVLMASTYPDGSRRGRTLGEGQPEPEGQGAGRRIAGEQSWDPAVKAIVAVPQVPTMMDEKLDWTQKLGDAFLATTGGHADSAEPARKAKDAGNLETTSQQVVKTEEQGGQTVVIIESAEPERSTRARLQPDGHLRVLVVPAPPLYYYYPPGYVAGPGLWFTAGVIVGGAIWGGCNWGRNEININVNKYNSFNRTNIKTGGGTTTRVIARACHTATRRLRKNTVAAATGRPRSRANSSAGAPTRPCGAGIDGPRTTRQESSGRRPREPRPRVKDRRSVRGAGRDMGNSHARPRRVKP